MNTQSEVVRLTRANARLKATIKRLERERDDMQRIALDAILGPVQVEPGDSFQRIMHPHPVAPGWTPPPHDGKTGDLRFVGDGIFAPPSTGDAPAWIRLKQWFTT